MRTLEQIKTVLELILLTLFLLLLIHIWRSRGTTHALNLLTNVP